MPDIHLNDTDALSYRSNYVQETSSQATSSSNYSHQRNDPLHLRHRWENELVGSAAFLFEPELQTPGLPRLQREQPSMKWMHGPSSDIVPLHDLGPQLYQCDDDCLEDYEPESDPGLTLLLENKHQAQGRKKCTSAWYQNITSRSYRRRLKASIRSNVSGFGSLLHKLPTVPMHKTMWNFKGRYNQLSSPSPTSRFISEEQFWLMLARFFGLAALPEQRRASFPSRDEIRYITNYVKSQPTPDDIWDNSDDIEDLVKICIQLTRFIFHNPESRRIFLRPERGPRQSQLLSWDLFQGFGAIEQFCAKSKCRQNDDPLSQYWSACLPTDLASQEVWCEDQDGYHFPAQHCPVAFRVWSSLRVLMIRAQKETKAVNRPTRLGLRHIYTVLSTTSVNSLGQCGIDFRHFVSSHREGRARKGLCRTSDVVRSS